MKSLSVSFWGNDESSMIGVCPLLSSLINFVANLSFRHWTKAVASTLQLSPKGMDKGSELRSEFKICERKMQKFHSYSVTASLRMEPAN